MRLFKPFTLAMLSAIILTACNSVEFKKTKGGMPYKIFSGKGKDSVKAGSIMKFHFKRWINDSLLFSSHDNLPIYLPVNGQSQPYDISELFVGLKEGDSIYAVQSVDSFLKKNPFGGLPPFFKAGRSLKTSVKVLKVFNSQQEADADYSKEQTAFQKREEENIVAYLKKNNIQANKTEHGTFVQVLDSGKGAVAEPGKQVAVKYKGYGFGGKVFDTNMDNSKGHTDPLTFVIGQGTMIPGFDEGIRVLREGGKAKLYIPSTAAFGDRPPPDIKPFENVIFDVELLKVQAPSPTQGQQVPGTGVDTLQKNK